MSETQAAAFADAPFFADAIRLRRWDEEGKIIDYRGPALDHFYPGYRPAWLDPDLELTQGLR